MWAVTMKSIPSAFIFVNKYLVPTYKNFIFAKVDLLKFLSCIFAVKLCTTYLLHTDGAPHDGTRHEMTAPHMA